MSNLKSGIRDNLRRGTVYEFLEQEIKNGSLLSAVSAYFTINAFEALQKPLNEIEALRFLFGDPDFIKSLDPSNTEKKAFGITDTGLELSKQLQQKPIAKSLRRMDQKRRSKSAQHEKQTSSTGKCIISPIMVLKKLSWAARILPCTDWV